MKSSKVPIKNDTLFNRAIQNTTSFDDCYKIMKKTIDDDVYTADVVFSVNGVDIDFNKVLEEIENAFERFKKDIEYQEKQDNIDKEIEEGIQRALYDKYYDIFANLQKIEKVVDDSLGQLEDNITKIENMYEDKKYVQK